jgi:hypothetical protein
LTRDVQRDTTKDKLDYIDAPHLVPIVTKEFDKAFAGVFGDFNKTRSWLQQAGAARNDHAHPRTGDFAADDVAHSLYAMSQVLKAAKLPPGDEIESIRKAVLGIEEKAVQEPAPAPAPARPAPAGQVPYWWEVCEPHDAFQNPAAIDESLFAATLGGVHAGSARDEYLKPDLFFAHTYFTENLKQTIRDVASRMNGGDGPAVTEMQTPFGGGKTHALLTLYHLIRNPEASLAVPGVKEAIGNVQIPPKARVLAFDGQEWGTEPVEKENGASVSTLWGELAFQVDPMVYHRHVMESDSRGEAPGNAVFREVLEAASPCLILIDELVSYLVKLRFANTRRTQNLYRQTLQFVQETLQLASNVKGACVLISLPKSVLEYGGLKPDELQLEIGIVDELQARADRVVSKRTPVNDEEIYTLMSRRLFKTTDTDVAERVARLYRETYERTAGLYDPVVLSSEYLSQHKASYPLHPELIDVVYKKWSTASDFPRTRTVLQLLANVVADQWVNRREAYSIQTAHVNLERERIRTKIVSAAGSGGGYDAVVAADIIGGDAHADMLDTRRGGDYERHRIARGLATTLLMHSFGGATRVGASRAELYLGTVAPNLGPEYLPDVVDSLEETLWYVHKEGELYRFLTKFNVYRVIRQTAEDLPAATVSERVREALSSGIGQSAGFRVLQWAGSDGSIADSPEPAIAVLDAKYRVAQDGDAVLGRERIDQLYEKVGGGLRQWRNSLVLVAVDSDLWGRAEEAMREVMAYESVLDRSNKAGADLSPNERKDLDSRLKDKKESLRSSVVTAYRWIFHPDEDRLTPVSLPVPATATETIAERVVARLSDQDYGHPKVMTKLSAVFFNSRLVPRLWKDDETSPLDLEETARRFRQWTYLPILPQRDETLRECIREGLSQQLWGISIGDDASLKYTQLIEKPEQLALSQTLFDGSASLVKGELLQLIRKDLAPDQEPEPTPSAGPDHVEEGGQKPEGEPKSDAIPPPSRRLTRLRIRLEDLPVTKTGNLQPYLFKVLQDHDAGVELVIEIDVSSQAGVPEEALDRRIIEGLEQLGIHASWEAK